MPEIPYAAAQLFTPQQSTEVSGTMEKQDQSPNNPQE